MNGTVYNIRDCTTKFRHVPIYRKLDFTIFTELDVVTHLSNDPVALDKRFFLFLRVRVIIRVVTRVLRLIGFQV